MTLSGILLLVLIAALLPEHARAQATDIVVTSADDSPDNAAVCPSETDCTLREAIETANGIEGEGEVRILFDPAVFAADPAAPIALSEPLPSVTRPSAVIDGGGATVVIDGAELEGEADGLHLDADAQAIRGVHVRNVPGTCLRISGANANVGGDRLVAGAVMLGGCPTALTIEGDGATVHGVIIGFETDRESAAPVSTGIELRGATATIGGEDIDPALSNVVGNAGIAVRVSADEALVSGNIFGGDTDGNPAPVAAGVEFDAGVAGGTVASNLFVAVEGASIALKAADAAGPEANGITISANTYLDAGGLEVDLGADGVRNPNDLDDADAGPNTLLNHPRITRPTQSSIEGIACGGCRVELYAVDHEAGGKGDSATQLLDTVTASQNGAFSIGSPPVEPGGWISATATDADGNTSEFSAPVRVGVGAIQCGNVALGAGWNLAGYFGASTVFLGDRFPGDPQGRIRAVYELGLNSEFAGWFRDTPAGRTLTTLVPGRAYWFYLDEPLVLPDGFSLTSPLGVPLNAGWNTFVYFGGEGDVRDAFSSLLGKGVEVHRFVAGRWESWGSETTPGYARAFDEIEACGAYAVYVDEAVILNPLHP